MDWETPDHIVRMVKEVYGGKILVDVASHKGNPTGAGLCWTPETDAFSYDDWGSYWYCNPPYGRTLGKWADHIAQQTREGIVLVPARTDTKWFHTLWEWSDLVCFIKGRLRFKGATAGAPFPSAVIYHGRAQRVFHNVFSEIGRVA